MNSSTIKNALMSVLAAGILISSGLLVQRHYALTETAARLAELEQDQAELKKQLGALNNLSQELTFQLREPEVKPMQHGVAPSHQSVSSTMPPSERQRPAASKPFTEANTATDTIFQTGYIDPDNWALADAAIKQLGKEESKIFWEKIFAGIESGAIKLDIEQFENSTATQPLSE